MEFDVDGQVSSFALHMICSLNGFANLESRIFFTKFLCLRIKIYKKNAKKKSLILLKKSKKNREKDNNK